MASASTRSAMEQQQNECARIITGCIRPTRSRALLAIADLPPLKNIAKQRAAALRERVLRLPEDTPARKTALRKVTPRLKSRAHEGYLRKQAQGDEQPEAGEDVLRPFRGCWRRIAEETVSASELDKLGRVNLNNALSCPWEFSECDVGFDMSVADLCSKQETEETRRKAAEPIMAEAMKSDIRVFTDGSVVEATGNGGAAAVVQTKVEERVVQKAAGVFCSSYSAEMTAIDAALEACLQLGEEHGKRISLLTDSMSSLMTLQQGPASQDSELGVAIWKKLSQLTIPIQLVWIPAHCGISGNEHADRAANGACALSQRAVDTPYKPPWRC